MIEASTEEKQVVGALVKVHEDGIFINFDQGGGINEIAEQMARLNRLIAVSDALTEIAIETTGHQGEL